MNFLILVFQLSVICTITLISLRFGKELLVAWLSLLAVIMNLFILKQITLFGLSVTCTDALAVGYLLGLNLIQEFFGKSEARKTVWISFFLASSFILLSQIHLAYIPNRSDQAQLHFTFLFSSMPRLILASLFTFITVQFFDLTFFGFLRKKTKGKYLTGRCALSLFFSQTLDTFLFTFLGLYGAVENIAHIIFLSLIVKGLVIFLMAPFIVFTKKLVNHEI